MAPLGNRLQDLIDSKGLRQADITKNVEIDQTQLSKICRGKTDVRVGSLRRIMEYLKPTPDELYKLIMGISYDD